MNKSKKNKKTRRMSEWKWNKQNTVNITCCRKICYLFSFTNCSRRFFLHAVVVVNMKIYVVINLSVSFTLTHFAFFKNISIIMCHRFAHIKVVVRKARGGKTRGRVNKTFILPSWIKYLGVKKTPGRDCNVYQKLNFGWIFWYFWYSFGNSLRFTPLLNGFERICVPRNVNIARRRWMLLLFCECTVIVNAILSSTRWLLKSDLRRIINQWYIVQSLIV